MTIYTKTGDGGETSLFGAGRVPKSDPRVAAYGDVDELNSAIGSAIACEPQDFESELLLSIQGDLMAVGSQLATPDPEKVAKTLAKAEIGDGRVRELEAAIDAADSELEALQSFLLPGGTLKAALLHQARTVCRRAERNVVALAGEGKVPEIIIVYLNRLSDVLFTLARLANHRAGRAETLW